MATIRASIFSILSPLGHSVSRQAIKKAVHTQFHTTDAAINEAIRNGVKDGLFRWRNGPHSTLELSPSPKKTDKTKTVSPPHIRPPKMSLTLPYTTHAPAMDADGHVIPHPGLLFTYGSLYNDDSTAYLVEKVLYKTKKDRDSGLPSSLIVHRLASVSRIEPMGRFHSFTFDPEKQTVEVVPEGFTWERNKRVKNRDPFIRDRNYSIHWNDVKVLKGGTAYYNY